MNTLLIVAATGCVLSGCAAVWPTTHDTLYFHENQDGTRYYALAGDAAGDSLKSGKFLHGTEGMLWVTREGAVYSDGGQLTPSVTKREDGEWDLQAYPIEPPSGYCVPLWSPKITRPESCWHRLWEVPSMMWIVGISALAFL